ncbi:TetR/AcrR family transcriptional regulator, partial [Nocardia farcinica]|uniref:TetR/AcrR family transcriptional regulator n=1 Tax=Nocardia farcinica TaxID=37329 RepID=UPI002454CBC2
MPEDDPAARRLLELLWRHALPGKPVARGPKPAVSVDEVVAAAVALADREGYEKVSIRAIAAALGLRPMSVYTYVPSKEALT